MHLKRVLLTIIISGFVSVAFAADLKLLEGAWAGHFIPNGSKYGVAIAIRVDGGKVVEYVWDGKPVKVTSTRQSDGRLHVKGNDLNIYLSPEGPDRATAVTANYADTAKLVRTTVPASTRPPAFMSDIYGSDYKGSNSSRVRIMSRYLERLGNYGTFKRKAQHAGMDFQTVRHREAIATGDGVVSWIGSTFNSFGCGNGLSIRHSNGVYSVYCHLEALADGVAVGKKINRGSTVGTIGSTGDAPPKYPHIHFEISTDGRPHADGSTTNTRNPADFLVGCYSASGATLPTDALTYPIRCSTNLGRAEAFGILSGKEVQERLILLGYDTGAPDGVLGPKSMQAIKDFQDAEGLSVSGKIDLLTEAALLKKARSN